MESRKHTFVLRLAMIAIVVSGLLACATGTVDAAGVERLEYIAPSSFISPCNGETIVVSGPVTLLYEAGRQHTIHLTAKLTGTGSLGNTYHIMVGTHGQFAAPTAVMGSVLAFEGPWQGEYISTGSDPNFAVSGTSTFFVENGQPLPMLLVADAATCHG